MKQTLGRWAARLVAGPGFALAVFGLQAAMLDYVPDAVLGKPDFGSAGGAATATNIMTAYGMAEDPVTGEFWVADSTAHRVLRFASAAAFADGEAANLVLGQADFISASANRGGAVAANTMQTPLGVAVDQAGRVYVSDSWNHRVLVFKPPLATGMNASEVIGQADFTSNAANRGGAVSAGTLNFPGHPAFDARGNLHVTDQYNHRVLRYDGPVRTGSLATRVFGQGGLMTTGTPSGGASGLSRPYAVTIDGADNLWVADYTNHRVLRYDLGATTGDDVADLVLCQPDMATTSTGLTASKCLAPTGVAVDHAGGVYVVDNSGNRILVFNSPGSGAAANAVIGQADFTSNLCNGGGSPSATTLCNTCAVILDRAGNLLASEISNGRVLRFDLPKTRAFPQAASLGPATVPQGAGAFMLTVNGSGFYGSSAVRWNGAALATQYLSPQRLVAQVPAGNAAAAGPYAITVATPAPGGGTSAPVQLPSYVRVSGDATADRVLGQPHFTTAVTRNPQLGEERVGSYNAAVFSQYGPIGLFVAPSGGRLFVAETSPGRIATWPSATAFYNGQPADAILGQPDEFSSGCNTGGIGARTLCGPYGLATDASGSLYAADMGNSRVLRFDPPFTTGMAASAVFGQGGSFTSNAVNLGGVSANSLNGPRGIAVSDSTLFVYDSNNRRILGYTNPRGDTTADFVIGQADLASSVADPASATRFGFGDGMLALGPEGHLFLSVMMNNRVLRFSPPFTNGMAADLVIGQASFTATVEALTAAGVNGPLGLALDPGGNLLVSDFDNGRVLRYAAPLASGMAASGVIGPPDFVSYGHGTTAGRFSGPAGIGLDSAGDLFVAEWGNARVLAFDQPFPAPLDPAGDVDGDGIPNGVEVTMSRDPYTKDNDIFSPGLGSATLFAMQQYRDFLAREGDASGISGWASLVAAGTYSRPQVIDAFLSSTEFGGVIAPVVRLYYATFLRVPDYAGLTYNAGLIRAGTVSLQQLADFFVASPEFAATYGALDNTQFVTLLYQNVLGRAPDQAGLDGWVAILNGGASRGSVLLGFSDSPEYQANMANEVFVTMMYAGMLRRTPETAGYNGWLAALDAGTWVREQVINGFFLSAEYHDRFLP